MSIAEELLSDSLDLVLHPKEQRVRNVRPDALKNPYSGHNLELDVLLPRFPIGIEVQGPHHYRSEEQIFRDTIKRQLCKEAGITLMEISIFEIRPLYIRAKLLDYSRKYNCYVNVQPRDPHKWGTLDRKITQYRKQIIATFGTSDDYTTPTIKSKREQHIAQNYVLARCLYVTINVTGRVIRAKPIAWSRSNKITVQELGTHVSAAFKVDRSLITSVV